MLNSTVKIKKLLESKNMILDFGVSNERILEIEKKINFVFPPDLRDLLMNFVPRGFHKQDAGFPDWNNEPIESLSKRFDVFTESVIFDITNNNFWYSKWGKKPEAINDRVNLAKDKLKTEPKPIPIYLHRCMLSQPNIIGNPILSIYQTDMIFYGNDLYDYFKNEFGGDKINMNLSDPKLKLDNFWLNVIWGKKEGKKL